MGGTFYLSDITDGLRETSIYLQSAEANLGCFCTDSEGLNYVMLENACRGIYLALDTLLRVSTWLSTDRNYVPDVDFKKMIKAEILGLHKYVSSICQGKSDFKSDDDGRVVGTYVNLKFMFDGMNALNNKQKKTALTVIARHLNSYGDEIYQFMLDITSAYDIDFEVRKCLYKTKNEPGNITNSPSRWRGVLAVSLAICLFLILSGVWHWDLLGIAERGMYSIFTSGLPYLFSHPMKALLGFGIFVLLFLFTPLIIGQVTMALVACIYRIVRQHNFYFVYEGCFGFFYKIFRLIFG